MKVIHRAVVPVVGLLIRLLPGRIPVRFVAAGAAREFWKSRWAGPGSVNRLVEIFRAHHESSSQLDVRNEQCEYDHELSSRLAHRQDDSEQDHLVETVDQEFGPGGTFEAVDDERALGEKIAATCPTTPGWDH